MQPAGVHMSSSEPTAIYPRRLRPKEQELLDFVLPADYAGYRHYRDAIRSMVVLGEGRRGKGNFVLGYEKDVPDTTSPLPAVVAYGIVETIFDQYSITVRELVENQIDVEIVSTRGGEIPDHFEEKRRWTYSTWNPGMTSPATGAPVREVVIEPGIVLAVAVKDKRLWVHDAATGMNRLVPITNYYNELMLHKHIRDPKIALASGRLFDDLGTYSDPDLRAAFYAYNALRPKVIVSSPPSPHEVKGWKAILLKLRRKKS
jgi:hypothetical protein